MQALKQINRLAKKDLFGYNNQNDRPKSRRVAHILRNKYRLKRFLKILGLILLVSGFVFCYLSLQNPTKEQLETQKKQSRPETQQQIAGVVQKLIPLKFSQETNVQEMNILTLGIPGSGHPGENLTDTMIVAHLEPNQKKLVLISLPRDLLVRIPNRQDFTKINHLYNLGGLEMTKQKIEEITGLSIDHYLLIDLIAAKEIIDLVDGLNIFVPQDINDPFFPGPNYSYQAFTLKAGWRYLDGETTLKYIRTRYTSPHGDFDRMSRQQQILRALKQKVLSLNPLWNFPTYLKIFNTLKEHIQTDLTLDEIKSLWQITQEIKAEQIISLTIDKERTNLLASDQIILGNQKASVVWPKAGRENYSEIREFIEKFID
jgi:LCP family protein required for cell wall assembly